MSDHLTTTWIKNIMTGHFELDNIDHVGKKFKFQFFYIPYKRLRDYYY